MAHAARLNLRMQKELKLLLTDPPPGVSLSPPSDGNGSSSSSLSTIEAKIEGPEGTVFSGGVFTIRVQVSERYPFQPPNVTFVTPIYHPNIDNGGRICLDILNLPPKGAWQPSLNISTVLTSIGLLMSEPNPDDGLMCETSREYKYNRQVFDEKARSWTEKYAKAGSSEKIYKTRVEDNTSNKVVCSLNPSPQPFEQEQEVTSEHGANSEGSRKKICITRQKLSLRTAVEKSKSDDGKENVAPVNPSCPQAKDAAKVCLSESKPPKQVVTCSSERHKRHKNIIVDESNDEKKIAEAYVVLDSEDSEEDDTSVRKSKLSQFGRRRRRGEWKGRGKEEKNLPQFRRQWCIEAVRHNAQVETPPSVLSSIAAADLITRGWNLNVVVLSSLIDGLCKHGRIRDAMEVFERMPEVFERRYVCHKQS